MDMLLRLQNIRRLDMARSYVEARGGTMVQEVDVGEVKLTGVSFGCALSAQMCCPPVMA